MQQRRDLDCVNAQLLASQALVDQLQRQLYGRRTEKSRVRCKREVVAGNESEGATKKRGSAKGAKDPGARRERYDKFLPEARNHKGPGRTPREKLPTVGEFHDVATNEQMCGRCGKAYDRLSFTHDSQIIEVYRQAIRRLIQRAQYQSRPVSVRTRQE